MPKTIAEMANGQLTAPPETKVAEVKKLLKTDIAAIIADKHDLSLNNSKQIVNTVLNSLAEVGRFYLNQNAGQFSNQ